MKTLHLLNTQGEPAIFCCRALRKLDAIVLFEEGVYGLRHILNRMGSLDNTHNLYVLAPDLAARGLILLKPAVAIDYDKFVYLTASYSRTISWF